jgi:hypothetical protein
VTVRTEKKIKRNRTSCDGEGACIQIVTEPEERSTECVSPSDAD